MAALIAGGGVDVVPVTAATDARVAEAYATWGKGNHPASLNFGDCFAYVLARVRQDPRSSTWDRTQWRLQRSARCG